MFFFAGFINILNPLLWLSLVINDKLEPAVSLARKNAEGLDYTDCTGSKVTIVFTDAKIKDGMLYLLLNTAPSVGERWAVITDQCGVPVTPPCIHALQIWKKECGMHVFKRDDDGGTEMMTALDEAMTLHNESLSGFASRITPDMTSRGMTSNDIISAMGKIALQKLLKA